MKLPALADDLAERLASIQVNPNATVTRYALLVELGFPDKSATSLLAIGSDGPDANVATARELVEQWEER